jgi:hypothetical protein
MLVYLSSMSKQANCMSQFWAAFNSPVQWCSALNWSDLWISWIPGIKESGLFPPSQWDLVSDKQMMQEEQQLQVNPWPSPVQSIGMHRRRLVAALCLALMLSRCYSNNMFFAWRLQDARKSSILILMTPNMSQLWNKLQRYGMLIFTELIISFGGSILIIKFYFGM